MNGKNYKLLFTKDDLDTMSQFEYHSNMDGAMSRELQLQRLGYKTVIIPEIKHLELKDLTIKAHYEQYSKVK